MQYEIEFFRVGEGACSGDAICLRYFDNSAWRVGVIDGGYAASGAAVRDHIRTCYGTNKVDFVVSTHPDNDHMSGLRVIVEDMDVVELYMHVPWAHVDQILHLFSSSRWTRDGLVGRLKAKYAMVNELLELAWAQGTNVYEPFEGERIGPFTVLSPSRSMYEGLLPQFRDTPDPDVDLLTALGHWVTGIGRRVSRSISMTVYEHWSNETLREGGITAAENESSVVLRGDFGGDIILLTGDAGLKALSAAHAYSQLARLPLQPLNLFQVPHHGSRNNVSPSVLDVLIGPPVSEGATRPIRCIVSAGLEDPHHPRQVVVNALVRRGLQPRSTREFSVVQFRGGGMPRRADWGEVPALKFASQVEQYD